MKTTDQRRASHAWGAITEVGKLSDKQQAEYKGEAKKLPTRIITAGLGPALAFLLAKARLAGPREKQKHHIARIHTDLSSWMTVRPMSLAVKDNLLHSILQADSEFLRWATDESLAYLQWLNRFADADLASVEVGEED